jgi:hypothetical protein
LTFRRFIGPIGSKRAAAAECFFVSPIADIAVLGSPDNQALFEQAEQYEAFLDTTMPFRVADAPLEGTGWVLTLDQHWLRCKLKRWHDGPLWISEGHIAGGMSGSPVVSDDGSAIGVVVTGDSFDDNDVQTAGGPQPVLTRDLPGWLTQGLRIRTTRRAKGTEFLAV